MKNIDTVTYMRLLAKARKLQAKNDNKYKNVFVHKDGPVLVQTSRTFPIDKPSIGWWFLSRCYDNPLGALVRVK